MPAFKIVTINILSDLSRWEERRPLLYKGLAEIGPDLIAVQEVNLHRNTAFWLASKLEYPHVFLSPKTGPEATKEGIAILSRLPFERQETLDLQTQNRVAQCVQVRIAEKLFLFGNGHFYWELGNSEERLGQVERFLDWFDTSLESLPVVICGDFNSLPDSDSILRMKDRFLSAYEAHHGREPEYTMPTPLPRSKLAMLHTLLRYRKNIHLKEVLRYRRGTLDYVFVNNLVSVLDCRLVLNQPDPKFPKIYPSDHFGLAATLEI